jgi:nicotinamide riboside kinase
MKYALIIGASENGKSTTINEVCKRLKPSKVWELNSEEIFLEVN